MIFTIAAVSFISTALSSFECSRYRFPLDGFFVVLAGLAVKARLLGSAEGFTGRLERPVLHRHLTAEKSLDLADNLVRLGYADSKGSAQVARSI